MLIFQFVHKDEYKVFLYSFLIVKADKVELNIIYKFKKYVNLSDQINWSKIFSILKRFTENGFDEVEEIDWTLL